MPLQLGDHVDVHIDDQWRPGIITSNDDECWFISVWTGESFLPLCFSKNGSQIAPATTFVPWLMYQQIFAESE
jgi:hypothetical protein